MKKVNSDMVEEYTTIHTKYIELQDEYLAITPPGNDKCTIGE